MNIVLAAAGVVLVTLGSAIAALAAQPEPTTLAPITHNEASLTVTGPEGETVYTPADLEALGAVSLMTVTPWRDQPTRFDGVLLTTLLARHGLADAAAVQVTAENDFVVVLPRAAWESTGIVVATRVDGKAHTRRSRGPIQFVMPMEDYTSKSTLNEGYWVWMAARIDAVE